jgi:hypothetical protein
MRLIYLLLLELVDFIGEILFFALVSLTIWTDVIVEHIPVFSLFILVLINNLVLDLNATKYGLLLLGCNFIHSSIGYSPIFNGYVRWSRVLLF